MPPLPLKSITVAGHRVRIKIDPNLHDAWGEYDADAKCITVGLRVFDEPDKFAETVTHELVHAALALSGVSFAMDGRTEEAVVRCMEQIFLPALGKFNSQLKIKPATE
jgi:hypothetical protein